MKLKTVYGIDLKVEFLENAISTEHETLDKAVETFEEVKKHIKAINELLNTELSIELIKFEETKESKKQGLYGIVETIMEA